MFIFFVSQKNIALKLAQLMFKTAGDNLPYLKAMNRSISFNCHAFFDNNTLCILEISVSSDKFTAQEQHYRWLLINKKNLSVRPLDLKSSDSSPSVQERFFDLGYLKYDSETGIFIEVSATELHPLENKNCDKVPTEYLQAVENYLSKSGKNNLTWIF
ncbi:MAG: hypothetical protein EOO92_01890 [Pedobacter sp.]|nr:MAG: hypothetical protein EOO92_01890 [Pedobacter sp.]